MNNDWRLLPITEKQINRIINLQKNSDRCLPKFQGGTRGEAEDYLSEYSESDIEIFKIPKR